MKKSLCTLCVAIILLPQVVFSQGKAISDSTRAAVAGRVQLINETIKEKGYRWKADITSRSYLSKEEMRNLCGVHVDTSMIQSLLERGDSLYQLYRKETGLRKSLTVPDWPNWMSKISDQGSCGNCWAHAATGVAQGLLQYYNGSIPGDQGINLDELDISDNADCGMGCYGTYYLDCGLSYIYSNRVRSQVGVSQFPNYDHAYYTISSYSSNTASINAIKSSLQTSPVNAGMYVYQTCPK